ncbi:CAAX prenyl protease-like protein [Anaerospora hongkongensis]|uniref:CAAX prenyl protease-like protein n=1 Tax=Anaerospora hongkongensis TaxID=244830 RepID=A0A4R1PMF2_9FIRM|nr:CPBP family intramembrane glutamic endopeptidase [Anaerospora hongkongensis]TCL31810.1 CAAX prenyl protease-like protein [Anaerospora hongkongensis]
MLGKKVWLYFFLAFLFTWLLWLPLLLNARLGMALPVLPCQHYLGSYGPLLAAALTTLVFEGGQGLRSFLGRVFRPVRQPALYAFALGTPVAAFFLAAALNWLLTGQWAALGDLGVTPQLPGFNLLEAWLFWMVTFGLGEEIGWRGLALHELQKIWKPVPASFILGAVWGLWHLPAFFYHGQYLAMGLLQAAGWLVAVLYGAVVFGWLRNATGGSVLIVALWHGTFDALIAGKAAVGVIPAVMSLAVIVFGIALIKVTKGQLGYSD